MAEEETSLRDDILNAMDEVKDTAPETVEAPVVETEDKPVDGRDEKGRFKSKEAAVEAAPLTAAVTAPVVEAPPQSLSPAAKAKWATIDPEVRAEIAKREADIHKEFTSRDGALSMGKELKEVITPYMAMIQSEGGTPATAVRDLLNTAYLLRTAKPETKVQLIQQVCQQYGIDIGQVQQPQQQDPQSQTLQQMQQELAHLRQATNPETIQRNLQKQLEDQQVLNEVKAFASDPSNKHYETVKTLMASLLGNGASKDLKEAYDMACNAHPSVRSILEAERTQTAQAKQTEQIAAKRKAAASVTGSPGATVPNSGAPDRNLRDEIRANLRAASS